MRKRTLALRIYLVLALGQATFTFFNVLEFIRVRLHTNKPIRVR